MSGGSIAWVFSYDEVLLAINNAIAKIDAPNWIDKGAMLAPLTGALLELQQTAVDRTVELEQHVELPPSYPDGPDGVGSGSSGRA